MIKSAPYYWVICDKCGEKAEYYEARFVPVPDLIRTVTDYEGLPDRTVLVITESMLGGIVDLSVSKVGDRFLVAGLQYQFTAAEMVARHYVCSVVRLGDSQ